MTFPFGVSLAQTIEARRHPEYEAGRLCVSFQGNLFIGQSYLQTVLLPESASLVERERQAECSPWWVLSLQNA